MRLAGWAGGPGSPPAASGLARPARSWTNAAFVRAGWTKGVLVRRVGLEPLSSRGGAGRTGASGGAYAAGDLSSSRGRPCRRVDPHRVARRDGRGPGGGGGTG